MSSKLVDERVVEMTFDNKKFESGVKQSMSTLDNFKESLNFKSAAAAMNASLASITVKPLSSALETGKKSFSSFADYVEFTIINRLTNKILDLGEKTTKALSIDQITAGWSKLESEAKSSGTLANIYEDMDFSGIEEQMSKLKWYSDATSYSYTTMMETLQQFASTGMDIDKAATSIMGIAQWAGQAGVGATEASAAMQRLSQAMMQDKVTWQQWESINLKGMNTEAFRKQLIETAKEIGTVTEDALGNYYVAGTDKLIANFDEASQKWTWSGFKDTMSDGWFTGSVLSETLSKYASSLNDIYNLVQDDSNGIDTTQQAIDAFNKSLEENEMGLTEEDKQLHKMSSSALEAASECRTLTDALNAAKDAVATGWMNIYGAIFGNYEEAKQVWNGLYEKLIYPIFIQSVKNLEDVFKTWNELGGRSSLFNMDENNGPIGALWNIVGAVNDVIDVVKSAFKTVFPFFEAFDGNKLLEFTKSLQTSTAKLRLNEQSAERLGNILKGLLSVIKLIGKAIKAAWTAIGPIINLAKSFAGAFVEMLSSIGKNVTDFANSFEGFAKVASIISNKLRELIDYVSKLEIIVKIKDKFNSFIEQLKSGFKLSEKGQKILEGFKSLGQILIQLLKSIVGVIAKMVIPAIGLLISKLVSLVSKIGPTLINFLAKISEKLTQFANYLKENNLIQNGAQKLVDFFKKIPKVLSPVWNFIKSFFSNIINAFKSFSDFVSGKTGKNIGDIFLGIFNSISGAVKKIASAIASFAHINTKPVEDFSNDVEKKTSPLKSLFDGLKSFLNGIWSVVKAVVPVIGKILNKIGDLLRTLAGTINNVFNNPDSQGMSLTQILTSGLIVAVIAKIASSIYNLTFAISALIKPIANLMSSIQGVIDAQSAKMYAEAFNTLTKSIIIIVAALVVLSLIDTKKLLAAAGVLTVLIGVLGVVFYSLTKLSSMIIVGSKTAARASKNISLFKSRISKTIDDFSTAMSQTLRIAAIGSAVKELSVALLILVTSLAIINRMDHSKIWESLGILEVILVSMVGLIGALTLFSKIATKKSIKAMKTIIGFAVSVSALVPAINKIGQMDTKLLIKAVSTISVIGFAFALMAKIIGTQGTFNKALSQMKGTDKTIKMMTKNVKTSVSQFVLLAAGIWLFSKAIESMIEPMKAISTMNTGYVLGFSGVCLAILGALSIMFKSIEKTNFKAAATFVSVLLSLSKGINMIAKTLVTMSNIENPSMLKQATSSMIQILTILSAMILISSKFEKDNKGLGLSFAGSCLMIAASLRVIADALKVLSTIDTKNIAIGVGVLTLLVGLLTAVTIVLSKMTQSKNTNVLGDMASAMISLSISLLAMALAIKVLGKLDLATLAKGLGAIIIVLVAVTASFVILSKLGPTLIIVAAAFAAVAISVYILASAFYKTAEAMGLFADNTEKFVESINKNSEGLKKSFKVMGLSLGLAIVEMSKTIGEHKNELISAFFELFLGTLVEMHNSLNEFIDEILSIVFDILYAIDNNIAELINVLGDICYNIVMGGLEFLLKKIPEFCSKLVDLICNCLYELGPILDEGGGKLHDALVDFAGHLLSAIGKFIFGADFVEGVKGFWNSTFGKAIEDAGNDLGPLDKEVKSYGANIIEGLGDGVNGSKNYVLDAFKSLGEGIANWWTSFWDIHSPSKVFASYGDYMVQGLAIGLTDNSGKAINAIDDVGNDVADSMTKILSNVSKSLNSDIGDDLVITPVLDLTEIQNGTDKISGMMNSIDGYEISGSNTYAVKAARSAQVRNDNYKGANGSTTNTTNNDNSSTVNNFYITGDSPDDIADKVAKELQKQVNKGKAVWGH